jgi:flap endonuclease-1
MGIKLKDIAGAKTITLDGLDGKILAIDGFNMLYQFLTTIRQRDGSLLLNSKGNVTSHLNGLFYRCTKFMEKGLKLVFIFDGTPPKLKATESARRAEIKRGAQEKFDEAEKAGDIDSMRKFASRTAKLTSEMVDESKELLTALGIPFIQAPSEGEAQAAHLVKKGDAYAAVSQDFDSLLFGAPKVIRNLSIEGKRKRASKLQFDIVRPEMIELSDVLNNVGIDQEQLIIVAILMGTDYNPKGIPGIGPKNAIKLVKEYDNFDDLFEKVEWKKHWDLDWKEILYTIKDMPVTDDYTLEWNSPNLDVLRTLLIDKHDFSADRVEQKLKKFVKEKEAKKQKGLDTWF